MIPGGTVADGQLVEFYPNCRKQHPTGRNLLIAEACRQDDSRKNVSGDSDGDRFIETHIFQPGPQLAEKVVPSLAVTDIEEEARWGTAFEITPASPGSDRTYESQEQDDH